MTTPRPFIWYELMTSDVDAGKAFYEAVVGWTSEPFGSAEFGYLILKAGETPVCGVMAIPDEAAQEGLRPCWVGYVYADDVDAATESLRKAGGKVHRAPEDIPDVGRFSVVADPQGAMFQLMSPVGEDGGAADPMAVGHVGWRELYAADMPAAFDFYAGQFGWTRGDAIDMGPMGTYQLFGSGPDQSGGMMTKPAEIPHPFWQFYFTVAGIDAAAERVKAKGGQVLMEPMQVPGGSWIVQCMDPQGAVFALTAASR